MDIEYTSESAIRAWLKAYLKPGAESAAEIDCIMAQDNWMYIDALADKFAGSQWQQGPEAFSEGVQFALSALVECHDGPHTGACPTLAWEMDMARWQVIIDRETREGKTRMVTFRHGKFQIGDPMRLTESEILHYKLEDGWTMDIEDNK